MKKIALIAAMSLAALVSCTKNETAPSVTEQQEITFASPVVGVSTKVPTYGLLSGDYPTTQTFNVWAWYSEKDTYDGEGVKKYMTDVTVAYDSKDFNNAEAENGAWAPTPTYYWPKNGKLTFDAYSPTELNTLATVACTASAGLTIGNYTVPTTLEKQIDVLYSERAADRVSANFTAGTTYEGVDIVFNHALAAVAFTIKQSEAYPAGTIKVQDIIINALSNGNFAHNIAYPAGTAAPAWTGQQTPAEYKALACADYENSVQPVNAEGAAGATVLVLPQAFSNTNDVTITVNYYIKNQNEDALLQKAVFHLKDVDNQSGKYQADQSSVTVNEWEMGKKYTYNLTIGLDDIFFAPTITEWVGVNVNLPEIK